MVIQQLAGNYEQTTSRIRTIFEGTRSEQLKQQENTLLNEAEVIRYQRDKNLRLERERLEAVEESMRAAVAFTETLLENGRPVDIATSKKALLARLQTLSLQLIVLYPCCDAVLSLREPSRSQEDYFSNLEVTRNLAKDCFVRGKPEDQVEVNEEIEFTIEAPKGIMKLVVSVAGPEVVVRGPLFFCCFFSCRLSIVMFLPNRKTTTFNDGSGTISVVAVPKKSGEYTVSVTLDEEQIQGSPFSVLAGLEELNPSDVLAALAVAVKSRNLEEQIKATTKLRRLLSRGRHAPIEALPMLTAILYSSMDERVLTNACSAICYLSNGENSRIQAVIDSGLVTRLVELLGHPSFSIQSPVLGSLGNIVTGTELQTQFIIDAGSLNAMTHLFGSPHEEIRKNACWMISNITAGSPSQIQAVIDAHLVPELIQVLTNDGFILTNDGFILKREAIWAIANATSGGTREQVLYLVEHGSVNVLCNLLGCHDIKITQIILGALETTLKIGEDAPVDGVNRMSERLPPFFFFLSFFFFFFSFMEPDVLFS